MLWYVFRSNSPSWYWATIIQIGGSYVTVPRIAERHSFRNWYQRNYPYPWVGGRVVYDRNWRLEERGTSIVSHRIQELETSCARICIIPPRPFCWSNRLLLTLIAWLLAWSLTSCVVLCSCSGDNYACWGGICRSFWEALLLSHTYMVGLTWSRESSSRNASYADNESLARSLEWMSQSRLQ